jgi:hypothetical protein
VPAPPGVGLLRPSAASAAAAGRRPAAAPPQPTAVAAAAAPAPAVVAHADRVIAGAGDTTEAKWLKARGIKSASDDYAAFMASLSDMTR